MADPRDLLGRRQCWLSRSFVIRQPAASTNAGVVTPDLDAREFVAICGGGSRPLAGLRSERFASPRFTSRTSAGRSGTWRPVKASSKNRELVRSPVLGIHRVRLGAMPGARLPTKWASPKVERPPVASLRLGRTHVRLGKTLRPCKGSLCRPHCSWAVSRAGQCALRRTPRERIGAAGADASLAQCLRRCWHRASRPVVR